MSREPKIGLWYTFCCELDITQILSEDEIAFLVDHIEECGPMEFYETREEAIQSVATAPPMP